ncbi:hypothetical protein LEMLEM_LOCUS9860 [Lemmus lemmus]
MSSAWFVAIRRLDITTTHLLVKAAKVRAKSQQNRQHCTLLVCTHRQNTHTRRKHFRKLEQPSLLSLWAKTKCKP